ncbi:MAG: DUF4230 domain-containing protein [Cyanobacteria bacterium CRU_2_1]|nr:DUF4230 domain-containing protein [Hydrococcus sp. RU_2_2]NJR58146.1 DUF4230 domain-containing protein [Cyanobacteria bacterium CRU_2_1]
MGIYRFRRQRNGTLQDCRPPNQTHCETPSDLQPQKTNQKTNQKTKEVPSQPRSSWRIRRRNPGGALKHLSLIVTGGAVLASVVAITGIWGAGSQFFADLYAQLTAPQPKSQVDVRPIVVQRLQNASELTTAVFAMETVVPTSRERTLGGYVIGKTTLLYIAYGEVRAGVDLSSLKPEDVQVDGNAITLRLPPPQILDSKIDVTRSGVYDYDRGFLGLGPDVAPELQELAERTTLGRIVKAACDQGVLQTANDRAKLTVSQLLTTAGYPTAFIETQPPSLDTCVQTAQIPAPSDVVPPEELPVLPLEEPAPSP